MSRDAQVDFADDRPIRPTPEIAVHRHTSGYVPRSIVLYRLYNMLIAGSLLLLTLPLILGLALTLRLVQGPGVLQRAPRIGLHEKPFELLRFRTFQSGPALPATARNPRAATLGHFLRATGLYELPQLVNVLRGDMNMVGPLPLRPAIAKIEAARDPLFAMRFTVKPGMFGHAQAFMSRNASQRLRGKLTYRQCRTAVNLRVELGLIARVSASIIGRAMTRLAGQEGRSGHLARARRKAQDWQMRIETPNGTYPVYAFSQGLLTTPHVVTGGQVHLVFNTSKGGLRRAAITLSRISHLGGETVFHYSANSETAAYTINRYLRSDALVIPATPDWQQPRVNLLPVESGASDTADKTPQIATRS